MTGHNAGGVFAHELYPPFKAGEHPPLSAQVPWLYARAVGLSSGGWQGKARMRQRQDAAFVAILADMRLRGVDERDALRWASDFSTAKRQEFVRLRAKAYGVPVEQIRTYQTSANIGLTH